MKCLNKLNLAYCAVIYCYLILVYFVIKEFHYGVIKKDLILPLITGYVLNYRLFLYSIFIILGSFFLADNFMLRLSLKYKLYVYIFSFMIISLISFLLIWSLAANFFIVVPQGT